MGVGGQYRAPAALRPGKRPSIHCTWGWVGPRASLDRCRKSRPQTVEPVARRYTDWAILAPLCIGERNKQTHNFRESESRICLFCNPYSCGGEGGAIPLGQNKFVCEWHTYSHHGPIWSATRNVLTENPWMGARNSGWKSILDLPKGHS
jgi:hypothetical protein